MTNKDYFEKLKEMESLKVGDNVSIQYGRYKGETANVLKNIDESSAYVKLENSEIEFYISKADLEI